MAILQEIEVVPLPPERFERALTVEQYGRFHEAVVDARRSFAGVTIWNVNSTAHGGGVAEMLPSLLAYARGAGVDARWLVIPGESGFFEVTKRIHNRLHGALGDGGALDDGARLTYEAALRPSAEELRERVRPGDCIVLHDPQTAGLVPAMRELGAVTVWRCHVGLDAPNDLARGAWSFLLPYVRQADAYVFTRSAFVWEGLDRDRAAVIPPSLDPFSAKNADLGAEAVRAVLGAAGVLTDGGDGGPARFTLADGGSAPLVNRAEMVELAPVPAGAAVVTQVSRWDRLKDPLGVMAGFADHVAPLLNAHLVLAGPAVEAVSDDPEGAEVLRECVGAWRRLPETVRGRVHLACLPMRDDHENAAIVNALQRRSDVVVQKSLAEGFGLTVAEAMWKGRPVVATRVGGIQDQVEHGRTGLLLDDPHDGATFGRLVVSLLQDRERAAAIGHAAREMVRARFLVPHNLTRYATLLGSLLR